MVICRFFQQNNCKFGTNCRNEHVLGDSAFPDINVLVTSVQADNLSTEKGGQWLLSCYAPFKEKPAIPGFEDKSFEEVRYEFYQAKNSGQIEQYNQQLQGLLQGVLAKIRALQNPTPEIVNMIKQIYNSPPNYSSAANTTNIVEKAQATPFANNSIFGGTAPQQTPVVGSIFGGQTTIQASARHTTGSIFAGPNQNQSNPFGGQSNLPFAQASSSPFGVPVNSPFGAPQAVTNSPFGVTQAITNSPFGVPQTATNSPFGAAPPTNSTFGGNQQTLTNPPFGAPAANSPFGVPQTTTNPPFGAAQGNNNLPFGTPQTTSSPFATNAQSATNSPFGGAPTAQVSAPFQNSSPFANPLNLSTNSSLSASYYSKIEDLDDAEMAMFQSNTFEAGKIPEKAPPYEMC